MRSALAGDRLRSRVGAPMSTALAPERGHDAATIQRAIGNRAARRLFAGHAGPAQGGAAPSAPGRAGARGSPVAPAGGRGEVVQRLPWTRQMVEHRHPGAHDRLFTNVLGQLDRCHGDRGTPVAAHVRQLGILEGLCIQWLRGNAGSPLAPTVEAIRQDAVQEVQDLGPREEVPGWHLAYEHADPNVPFQLHEDAFTLFRQGKKGQGYFGAVDMETGVVYLIPGYNHDILPGTPPEQMEDRSRWVVPRGYERKTWRDAEDRRIPAALAEPLGLASGGGHRHLAQHYGLQERRDLGALIGFGIFKGGFKHLFKEFRNRSAGMNTTAIAWDDAENISTWRKRGIPQEITDRLYPFLRTSLRRASLAFSSRAEEESVHPEATLVAQDTDQRMDRRRQRRNDAIALFREVEGGRTPVVTEEDVLLARGPAAVGRPVPLILQRIDQLVAAPGAEPAVVVLLERLRQNLIDGEEPPGAEIGELMQAMENSGVLLIRANQGILLELLFPDQPEMNADLEHVPATEQQIRDWAGVLGWQVGDIVRYLGRHWLVDDVEGARPVYTLHQVR